MSCLLGETCSHVGKEKHWERNHIRDTDVPRHNERQRESIIFTLHTIESAAMFREGFQGVFRIITEKRQPLGIIFCFQRAIRD